MAQNKWNKLFKGMKKKWNEARKNKDQAFVPLAEGQYYVRLAKCALGESKSGSPQVSWAFVVVDGENKGKQVWAWDNMDSEWGLQALARRLDILGHDLADLGDLPEVMDGLVEEKPLLKVRVRHSKAKEGDRVFVNVDFERLLDDETEIEDEDASFDDLDSNLSVSSEDEDADLGDEDEEEDEDDEEEHEDDDEDEEDEEEEEFDQDDDEDEFEEEEDEEDEPPPKKRGRPKKDKAKAKKPENKKASKAERPKVGRRTVTKRAPSKQSKAKKRK